MNHILPIDDFMARPFIRKWHYTKRGTRGNHYYYGWFVDKHLYAVADYGIGAAPNQARGLASLTMLNITKDNLLELKRLCRTEPKLDLNLTQFLAKCHKNLKRMGFVYIISFTDPEEGHTGGIYRAANFEYLGKTNAEHHYIDAEGNKRHRHYPYRYSQRNHCSMEEAAKKLGLTRVRREPKDRWLLCINKKRRSYEFC